jgi:hypothetical protein
MLRLVFPITISVSWKRTKGSLAGTPRTSLSTPPMPPFPVHRVHGKNRVVTRLNSELVLRKIKGVFKLGTP